MEWKPHVTVAAIICNKNKYLFVEEKINNNIVINQPAGHLEKDESLTDAIIREVFEETGGNFSPTELVGIYHYWNNSEDKTYIRFCFHGNCLSFDDNAKLDKKIIKTLWLTKEELNNPAYLKRSPIVIHCINDYESGNRLSLKYIKSKCY